MKHLQIYASLVLAIVFCVALNAQHCCAESFGFEENETSEPQIENRGDSFFEEDGRVVAAQGDIEEEPEGSNSRWLDRASKEISPFDNTQEEFDEFDMMIGGNSGAAAGSHGGVKAEVDSILWD